jgi:hypothetical protein
VSKPEFQTETMPAAHRASTGKARDKPRKRPGTSPG